MNFLKKLTLVLKKIIAPYFLQIPSYFRLGKGYRAFFNFLVKSDAWTDTQKQLYKCSKLQEVLDEAVLNVPYYAEQSFATMPSSQDINLFPILTKDDIRANLKSLTNSTFSFADLIKQTTGGSTSYPLEFYSSRSSCVKEYAFIDFVLHKAGISNKKFIKKVVFRGDVLPGGKRFRKFGNVLYLSSFHLSSDDLSLYIRLIRKFKPVWIHAYPSSIVALSQYILANDKSEKIDAIKLILTSSETFSIKQKQLVKNAFEAKICDLYGNSELTVFGYQFDFEHGVFPFQYSNVEVDDNNALITTSLLENGMPFLRYYTGDLVSLPFYDSFGGICGYEKILGREHDYIVGFHNEKVYFVSLHFHDDTFSGVDYFQFYQPKIGVVILRVVEQGSINKPAIIKYLNDRLPGFDCSIISMEQLPRTKAGKVKVVIKDF